MAAKAVLEVDLFAIHIRGTDAFGREFDIALEQDDARRLIFKLHRMVLQQAKMRARVNKSHDGGKVA